MECPPGPAGPNRVPAVPVERPEMDPDHALVRGLAAGDMGALRSAYERHGARVQRLCLRLLGSPAEAEDAAQEVFLRLFERAASFDGRARFSTSASSRRTSTA